jgi:tetratricopeptide (TPR) repeat protein
MGRSIGSCWPLSSKARATNGSFSVGSIIAWVILLGISNSLYTKSLNESPVMPLLQNDIDQLNGKEIITRYLQLKKQYQDSYAFDSEDSLNTLGYYLLNKKRTDDAIEVLQYNTLLFPKSGNVFDSLGEAYLTKGDHPNALKNYKRAVALDPANENAKNIINKIENK